MDKTKNQLQVSVSEGGFVDEGDGLVSFPNGLTITDSTTMRSGTRYDIQSLDITRYGGQLTADHHDSLGTLIGKTIGVSKDGMRVTVQAIKYAIKENPYARIAYDLLVGGFSNSFSIETIGPPVDGYDPVFRDHELVGLSQVVVPNNYNAKLNQFNEIVHNSLERSQKDGLDITGVESKFFSKLELVSSETVQEENMAKALNASQEVKETEAIEKVETEVVEEVKETVEAVEEKVEEVQEAPETVDNDAAPEETEETEKEAEVEETQAEEAEEAEEATETEEVVEEAEEALEAETVVETTDNKTNKEETVEMNAEQIAEIVANAIKPLAEELNATKELAQNALDVQAKEPEFTAEKEENSLDGLSSQELFSKQLNAAVAVERMQSVEAAKTLNEINARNLQALKDAKMVSNALTLEDLGNFVIGPELATEIAGKRSDYSAILDETDWKETNAIEFGWLTRSNDIDMSNVALGAFGDVSSPDTSDNRLKPVSMPGYGAQTDKLEEMAAVTPISINVIKFAAADILSDIAEGYRNDYDRKRAQLVIARLQGAVNNTGNKLTYKTSDGIDAWIMVVAEASDTTTVGKLILNNKSLAEFKRQAIESKNPALLTEIASGHILGTPFIVVPNDLLPTLNTTETRSFAVHGTPVTVDQAVFYADLSTFTGRTSGGLKYDVDGSASYEVNSTVYSAYQRNEVVLRGSFFRGGVVKDETVVAAIASVAIS